MEFGLATEWAQHSGRRKDGRNAQRGLRGFQKAAYDVSFNAYSAAYMSFAPNVAVARLRFPRSDCLMEREQWTEAKQSNVPNTLRGYPLFCVLRCQLPSSEYGVQYWGGGWIHYDERQ